VMTKSNSSTASNDSRLLLVQNTFYLQYTVLKFKSIGARSGISSRSGVMLNVVDILARSSVDTESLHFFPHPLSSGESIYTSGSQRNLGLRVSANGFSLKKSNPYCIDFANCASFISFRMSAQKSSLSGGPNNAINKWRRLA
jgi:hypothetical protein